MYSTAGLEDNPMTSTFVEKDNPDVENVADSLREKCSELNLTERKPWNASNKKNCFYFFLVLDRFKTIYCYVPKAGSTTWKTLIANASGFRHEDFRHLDQDGRPEVWIHDAIYAKYPRLGQFSEKEIEYKLPVPVPSGFRHEDFRHLKYGFMTPSMQNIQG